MNQIKIHLAVALGLLLLCAPAQGQKRPRGASIGGPTVGQHHRRTKGTSQKRRGHVRRRSGKRLKAQIIDNGTMHLRELKTMLGKRQIRYSVAHYKTFKASQARAYDFVVLSGGSDEIKTNRFLRQERKLIRNGRKPIFGICAGFEIIANEYGKPKSRLPEKLPEAAEGIKSINLVNLRKWKLSPPRKKLKVFEHHGWGIRIPIKGFTTMGSSKYGLEIIKHNSKPILATQFHPEVTKGNNGAMVFDYFLKNMVRAKAKKPRTGAAR